MLAAAMELVFIVIALCLSPPVLADQSIVRRLQENPTNDTNRGDDLSGWTDWLCYENASYGGEVIDVIKNVMGAKNCQHICKDTTACEFFLHHELDGTCELRSTKIDPVVPKGDVVSGPKQCLTEQEIWDAAFKSIASTFSQFASFIWNLAGQAPTNGTEVIIITSGPMNMSDFMEESLPEAAFETEIVETSSSLESTASLNREVNGLVLEHGGFETDAHSGEIQSPYNEVEELTNSND